MSEKVKGQSAGFRSIGKSCGKPVGLWKTHVRARTGMNHPEIVNRLKAGRGLGHGHANALVAHALAEKQDR